MNQKMLRSFVLLAAVQQTWGQLTIAIQPSNQIANQGFKATFTATVSGSSPLSLQWYFAANSIPWATTNSLTLTNAMPPDAGEYFLVARDSIGSVTSRTARLTVVLPASLDPKLGRNLRIGSDPFTKTNLHQAEIHIDRSWTDTNLLLTAFQDALASDEPLACSYALSRDGGFTWQGAFIPGVSKLTGGIESAAADNMAAIDLQNNLFLLSAPYSVHGGEVESAAFVLSRSIDGGHTFSEPLTLVRSDASFYPERSSLTVNTFRDSPTAGRLAFAFTRSARSGLSSQSYVRYSDDQGVNWSSPIAAGPSKAFGPQVFFLPNGNLGVVYRQYQTTPVPNEGPGRIEIVLSEEGGQTFSAPFLVQDLTGKFYSVWPQIWDAVHFPSVGVDRQAGVIYVAYQALGANKRKSIMFTRSIDRGRTWSAPTGINDTPNNYDVFSPALAVSPDGQHVTVEFYDQRNQTTNSLGNYVDLYLAESFDGGNTWQPNLRLSEFSSDLRKAARRTSDAGAFLGEYQAMVPSANLQTPAVAAWIDTRAGNNDPYSVRIARTTGTSFDAWRRLRFSTNDFANAFISGEQADPDGDGLPNLAEYALGREPARVDAVSFTATRVNDGKLSLSFERLAVLGDIQFSWQTSTNLVNWVAINPTQEIVVSGRDPWMERVTDSFTPGEGRAFYRLGVKLKTP